VSVKTSHRCAYQLFSQQSNQKELRLDFAFGPDITGWVIMRRGVREDFLPELNDVLLICFAERANSNIQKILWLETFPLLLAAVNIFSIATDYNKLG
jgi:hypothetical protein